MLQYGVWIRYVDIIWCFAGYVTGYHIAGLPNLTYLENHRQLSSFRVRPVVCVVERWLLGQVVTVEVMIQTELRNGVSTRKLVNI